MKYFALVFLMVAFSISCKKNLKEQNHNCSQGQHWDNSRQTCVSDSTSSIDTTSNLLSDTTILVDSSYVLSSSETAVTINSTNFPKQPTVGCILIAPPCTNAQYGFMRKVTSITGTQDNLLCQTEFCGLNEAFKQLHFDDSTILNSSTFDSTTTLTGFGNSSNGAEGVHSFTFKIKNLTVATGLTITGTLKINITAIRKKYDKGKNFVLPKEMLFEVDMNTEGSSIEIANSNTLEIKVDKKLLSSKNLGIIEVPIPVLILVPPYVIVIPIPFLEKLSLYTMPFTIGAKMKLHVLPTFYSTIGAHYINNQWINTSTASFKPTNLTQFCKKDFFISGGFGSELTLINPAYELLPFGSDFLKFSLEAPANVTLTVQTNSPNYSLKGEFQVNGNMEAKIWTGNQQKISIGTTLYELKVAEGDWVTCGDTLSLTTNSVSSITQNSAISGGNILSDGGSPITERGVCWSTSQNPTIGNNTIIDNGTGIGSFISNITDLTANKMYHVRAYATNNAGIAYGNDVGFTTSGDATGGVINYTVASFERIYHDSKGVTSDATSSGDPGSLTLYPNTDSCSLQFGGTGFIYSLHGKYSGTDVTLSNMAFVDGLYHPLSSPITFSTLDQKPSFTIHIAYYFSLNDETYYEDDPVVLQK